MKHEDILCKALLFHHYLHDKVTRLLVMFDLPPLLQSNFLLCDSLCRLCFMSFEKIVLKNYKLDNLFTYKPYFIF